MQDRVPLYPGRVTLTPVSGQANTFDLTRADQPTQEGTPLNKASLLKDATAALYGLPNTAVPDNVLSKIKTLIDSANANANTKARIATGSYTGTGTYGSSHPNSLTFEFAPKVFAIYKADSYALNMFIFPVSESLISLHTTPPSMSGANQNNLIFSQFSHDSKTLKWYSTDNYEYQCNRSRAIYSYIALG